MAYLKGPARSLDILLAYWRGLALGEARGASRSPAATGWPSRAGYPLVVRFGMYPLKMKGVIRQCLAIEDCSAFPAAADIDGIPFEDPTRTGQEIGTG